MTATASTSSSTSTAAVASTKGPAIAGLVGAAGFALSYFASDPISSSFATGPAPQPNVSGDLSRAWLLENATAGAVQAAIMVVSVAFLALFVSAVAMITQRVGGGARRAAIGAGIAAVVAMVVSSGLSWVLSASAASLTPDTVAVLRTAGFIAGGTAHVAFLGLFALATSRIPGMSKPVDRKSTRLNSSHLAVSRMPSSA